MSGDRNVLCLYEDARYRVPYTNVFESGLKNHQVLSATRSIWKWSIKANIQQGNSCMYWFQHLWLWKFFISIRLQQAFCIYLLWRIGKDYDLWGAPSYPLKSSLGALCILNIRIYIRIWCYLLIRYITKQFFAKYLLILLYK